MHYLPLDLFASMSNTLYDPDNIKAKKTRNYHNAGVLCHCVSAADTRCEQWQDGASHSNVTFETPSLLDL